METTSKTNQVEKYLQTFDSDLIDLAHKIKTLEEFNSFCTMFPNLYAPSNALALDVSYANAHVFDMAKFIEVIKTKASPAKPTKAGASATLGTTPVISLFLNNVQLSADQIKKLCEDFIKDNAHLESLSLRFNPNFDETSASTLRKALWKNQNLKTLDLGVCKIKDDGTSSIADILNNSALTNVNLRNNLIGDKGAKKLATALTTNLTLEKINLGENNFTQVGLKDLHRALKINNIVRESLEIEAIKVVGLAELTEQFNKAEEDEILEASEKQKKIKITKRAAPGKSPGSTKFNTLNTQQPQNLV